MKSSVGLTRRTFFDRATAIIGGLLAYAVVGPAPPAIAASPCRTVPGEIQKSTTCRVQFGPPSCTESRVTVYSPNNRYELFCVASCRAGCGRCYPTYAQARGAVCNDGRCTCTARYF